MLRTYEMSLFCIQTKEEKSLGKKKDKQMVPKVKITKRTN